MQAQVQALQRLVQISSTWLLSVNKSEGRLIDGSAKSGHETDRQLQHFSELVLALGCGVATVETKEGALKGVVADLRRSASALDLRQCDGGGGLTHAHGGVALGAFSARGGAGRLHRQLP